MGNTLNLDSPDTIVSDDPLLKEYKSATIDDFKDAKENFDTLQATVGDKMTVTPEEFDEIFSIVCQDPVEHFQLFDVWEVNKVDVMEVFAVIIAFCDATIEEKIPLIFDLFDFHHSQQISQDELVLLMLCTTRGLCKVVGRPRPATDALEKLTNEAFSHTDRSDKISMEEFTQWILQENNVMTYLAKFSNTRVIYDNQVQNDVMLKEICTVFMSFANMDAIEVENQHLQTIYCPEEFCADIIQRFCPSAEEHEIAWLLRTMKIIMKDTIHSNSTLDDKNQASVAISMDAFFLVIAPYAAFLAVDGPINTEDLKILIWLLRGSEPSSSIIDNFMTSLAKNHGEPLSAMEWVLCSLKTDKKTGSQSFANQLFLLFSTTDLSGSAMLSLPELQTGLTSILADHLDRVQVPTKREAVASPESAWEELTTPERVDSRHKFSSIPSLVAELAQETTQELAAINAERIEWYEFRQCLDYLEQRVLELKFYIQEHVLDS